MMCMVAFGGPQQLEPDEVAARDDVQFQQSLEAVLDNNESAARVKRRDDWIHHHRLARKQPRLDAIREPERGQLLCWRTHDRGRDGDRIGQHLLLLARPVTTLRRRRRGANGSNKNSQQKTRRAHR